MNPKLIRSLNNWKLIAMCSTYFEWPQVSYWDHFRFLHELFPPPSLQTRIIPERKSNFPVTLDPVNLYCGMYFNDNPSVRTLHHAGENSDFEKWTTKRRKKTEQPDCTSVWVWQFMWQHPQFFRKVFFYIIEEIFIIKFQKNLVKNCATTQNLQKQKTVKSNWKWSVFFVEQVKLTRKDWYKCAFSK